MTRIRSHVRTVFKRCAIVNIVQSANASLIVPWTKESVSLSIAAVASSNIMMRECRSNALAMHSSWRSPTLKFSPFSTTSVSSFIGRFEILTNRKISEDLALAFIAQWLWWGGRGDFLIAGARRDFPGMEAGVFDPAQWSQPTWHCPNARIARLPR